MSDNGKTAYKDAVIATLAKGCRTFDDVYFQVDVETDCSLGSRELYDRAVKRCKALGIPTK
jgi:hypothetical protein